jgi:hypothetical protein
MCQRATRWKAAVSVSIDAERRTQAEPLGRRGRHPAGGMRLTVHFPDEVQLKIELELESDKRELEIELTW